MDDHDLLYSLDGSNELKKLVESRKWNVVADLCEKRLKKSDAHDALQICRFIAILLDKRPGKKPLARAQLIDFVNQRNGTRDPAILSIVDSLARACHGDVELSNALGVLWDRGAANLRVGDDWIFKAWFETKTRKGLYNDAKQATMAWMKAFPTGHEPFYLFILSNYIISRSLQASQTDRRLCQMLAFKALATATANTVDGNGRLVKDSGRVLESEEDLLLLLRIYKDQGKYREGLNILDDTQKGFASPIGKCSWDLAMQMIELHGLCENWEFQYHICHEILQESRPSMFNCETSGSKLAFGNRGDDWKVWITLVAAAGKLLNSKPEFLIKTEHLILGFAEPRSRNASLAAISLHLQAGSEVLALERGYKNIKTYFEDYGTKTACFQELRPHLESLSRSHQEMLVTDVRQFSRKNHELRAPSKVTIAISLPDLADRCQASCANHIIRETNSLKIDYYLLISRTNEQDQSRMVFSFVKTCLKLYKSSLVLDLRLPQSDRGPADDAAILAAVALMRLYIAGNKKAIFHSVLILEYLLSHSKHNYEALLILIRLYLHLGNGSLAIDRFSRLSIKNIQHASIAWVLFTRLSTIHPWAANLSPGGPSPGPLDPLQELETGLRWHEKAGGLTDNALHANIRNEQWGMILGLFDVQNAIQNGFGRTTLAVEYLRLQRLRTNAQDRGRYFAKIPSPPLKDNRDRSVFPKYESTGQAALDEFLPTSSFPLSLDLQWLVRELHLANLWDCLGSRLWSQTDLENLRRLAQSSTVDSVDSLTGSEKMADDILNLLSGIVRPLSASSGPIDAEETLTRLDDLGKRLRALWRTTEATGSNPSQGTLQFGKDHSLPLWVTLHHEFTLIEIALFIRRGMNWMKAHYASVEGSKKSEILEQVTGVASGCRTLLENIHSQASIWRETIPAFGFEELMTGSGVFNDEDDNLVKEIPRLIGREMVTSVCEKMKESYLDAIRGLLRSSLPPSL